MVQLKLCFLLLLSIAGVSLIEAGNMVCFYDSASFLRQGLAQFSLTDLEPALQFCNYLIYGYAGIDPQTYQIKPLNENLDISRNHYRNIIKLKQKFPQLRVLLSIGGDHDPQEVDGAENNKYLQLLEEPKRQQNFIDSAVTMINSYGFDGIDLAWQFPKKYPKQVKGAIGRAWGKFKGWFTGPKVVDEKAEDHKTQFNAFVRSLRTAFGYNGPIVSLTMLPNVDTALFVDVFVVSANIDFVNLAAFDFKTPERDPKEADYTALLYEMYERDPTNNVDFQVQYWLNKSAAASIINVGIPTYGRAWVMSKDSGITGFPPVPETMGAAPGGPQLNAAGLFSWPEICESLSNYNNNNNNNNKEPWQHQSNDTLRKVGDPQKRFGIYAYRAADEKGENGVWVSYEDPASAAIKAGYVFAKGLAGVALFDLSLDDFRGQCAGEKFPILRSIKHRL